MKRTRMILAGLLACALPAWGQLTAVVTPGYTFSSGERPTIDTLNQLGQPTIQISGTVSGSNSLAAGSVSGVYLSDSVVDGRTTSYTNTSPRAIQVKAGGINTNELNAGLYGNITNALAALAGFTTNSIIVTNAMRFTCAHGLATTPGYVRAVLVCTNNENGYTNLDEVMVDGIVDNHSAVVTWATYGANATNLFFSAGNGSDTLPRLGRKTGSVTYNTLAGTNGVGVLTNWVLKIYARP